MKNLLTITDLSPQEIIDLLDFADLIKTKPYNFAHLLESKCIVLIFEKTSTRTRISFENGMYQMGGNVIYLDWRTANFHLGSLRDEILCISGYVDLIMARVNEHKSLQTMANASRVPIINGLSDKFHPCQALADLMTIREQFQNFKDISIAFIGDGNNVCNSLIIGCLMMKIPIHVSTPTDYQPAAEVLNWARIDDRLDLYKWTENPEEAVKSANIVYTDTFISIGQEEETEKRLEIFKPYQINSNLLSVAENDPYIMHCLPAHRGIEITDKILDSKKSIVFQQAENRMYLQKALMATLLGKN